MKKSIFLIILFLIIGLMFGAIGGYYYAGYKSDNKKSSNVVKKTEKVVKEENLDVTDARISKAFSRLATISCDFVPYRAFLEKSKLTIDEVSVDLALQLVDANYYMGVNPEGDKNVKTDSEGNYYKEVSAEELEKQIKSILGENYKFEHKTYESSALSKFIYDKDKKQYKVVYSVFGCTVGPHAETIAQVTKATLNGDKLVVNYRVLFGEESIPEKSNDQYYAKYYKDIKLTKQISKDDLSYMWRGDNINTAAISLENLSLGANYQFTFEKQNDNYVFVSSELVK